MVCDRASRSPKDFRTRCVLHSLARRSLASVHVCLCGIAVEERRAPRCGGDSIWSDCCRTRARAVFARQVFVALAIPQRARGIRSHVRLRISLLRQACSRRRVSLGKCEVRVYEVCHNVVWIVLPLLFVLIVVVSPPLPGTA